MTTRNKKNKGRNLPKKNAANSVTPSLDPKSPSENLKIQSIVQQSIHSGPIPDPETLMRYEKVISGGADRIVSMAENQQNSRINYECNEQTRRYDERRLGQICAFIICLLVIVVVYKLAMNDKEIAASVLGVGGLAGIVTAFRKSHNEKVDPKPDKNNSRSSK